MNCAKCDKDFKEDESLKAGGYTQQNAHFGRPFRQFGYSCPFCRFHNTIFAIPVKVPFIRSGRTYDKLDALVEKFKNDVAAFYANRRELQGQLSLYEPDDEPTKENRAS